MSALTNGAASALMRLLFRATTWTGVAQNASSSPITNIECSLHTADPGDAGTQITSEASYGSYARVAVARTAGGWNENGSGVVNPVSDILFPAVASGSGTLTHLGLGAAHTSTGELFMRFTISPSLSYVPGSIPTIKNTSAFTLT